MHLAGHTYAFRRLALEDALDRIAGLGLTDVELWVGHVEGTPQRAHDALERTGLRARAVSAGGFYRPEDEAPARAAELARAVGATVVVSCVRPELLPLLAQRVGDGIELAVENHWDQPLDRARRVAAALAGTPAAGACLDTGHALAAGESPAGAARQLGERLVHVHLKDAARPSLLERLVGRRARKRFLPRPSPVDPGTGALDVRSFHHALVRLGFAGTVSLEHEGDEPERALAQLLARWREAAQAT